MRVEAWDCAFIRAGRRDVHPLLVDAAGYDRWWPGARCTPGAHGTSVLRTRPPGAWARHHTIVLTTERIRPDAGVHFGVTGWARGRAEWYYLDERGGVVVHWLLCGDIEDRGWRRALYRHRCAVRLGLQGLKDLLEGGRPPGAEPPAVESAPPVSVESAPPGSRDGSR